MRITESRLRQLIRETLFTEARITPDNIPDDITFRLSVSSTGGMITVTAYKQSVEFGFLEAHRVRSQDVPCYEAYEVGHSGSQLKGFGPLIYDIAVEAATELGGGLMSDRMAVSDSAYNVWRYYQHSRPDVKRLQLDSPENEITPIRKDNCNVNTPKNITKDKFGDESRWPEDPLSGVYQKPGMETIRQLIRMGKIQMKGIYI